MYQPWSYVRQAEGDPFVEWAVGRLDPPSVFAKGRCKTWKEARAACSLNRGRQDTYAGAMVTRGEMLGKVR